MGNLAAGRTFFPPQSQSKSICGECTPNHGQAASVRTHERVDVRFSILRSKSQAGQYSGAWHALVLLFVSAKSSGADACT